MTPVICSADYLGAPGCICERDDLHSYPPLGATPVTQNWTFCGGCGHPMHRHECGADANLTAGPCKCRNDQDFDGVPATTVTLEERIEFKRGELDAVRRLMITPEIVAEMRTAVLYELRQEWDDAKRTKASTMHDVGGVINVVDELLR